MWEVSEWDQLSYEHKYEHTKRVIQERLNPLVDNTIVIEFINKTYATDTRGGESVLRLRPKLSNEIISITLPLYKYKVEEEEEGTYITSLYLPLFPFTVWCKYLGGSDYKKATLHPLWVGFKWADIPELKEVKEVQDLHSILFDFKVKGSVELGSSIHTYTLDVRLK